MVLQAMGCFVELDVSLLSSGDLMETTVLFDKGPVRAPEEAWVAVSGTSGVVNFGWSPFAGPLRRLLRDFFFMPLELF